MTDQTVPANKVREIISKAEDGKYDYSVALWLIRDLLPAPKPRTLADMTPEERDECRFMAAEVATGRTWYIIGRAPGQYGQWIVVTRSGRIETRLPEHITPLPDLPRLQWPDPEPLDPTDQQNLNDMAVDEEAGVYDDGGPFPVSGIGFQLSGSEGDGATVSESEKLAHDQPEPQPGEAWLVETRDGAKKEALKAPVSWHVKDGGDVEEWVEEALTPIARLVPEQKPRELNTEDHFQGAPIGTIVRWNYTVAEKKGPSSWFTTAGHWNLNNAEMSLRGIGTVIWEPEVG